MTSKEVITGRGGNPVHALPGCELQLLPEPPLLHTWTLMPLVWSHPMSPLVQLPDARFEAVAPETVTVCGPGPFRALALHEHPIVVTDGLQFTVAFSGGVYGIAAFEGALGSPGIPFRLSLSARTLNV